MKVIITGATGMVGKGVLLACLDHPQITEVLSISRRATGTPHSKLKELIHADFSEFDSIKENLNGYSACYACMGVSAARMSEAEYTMKTYDYTLAMAKVLHHNNEDMTFIYVSGQGTNSSEKGMQMWARVKGKTENDLLKLGFQQAFMFRPGIIIPQDGIKPSSKLYRVLVNNLKWSFSLIKRLAPNAVVDTRQIGMAMINATLKGYTQKIVHPKDIIALAQ